MNSKAGGCEDVKWWCFWRPLGRNILTAERASLALAQPNSQAICVKCMWILGSVQATTRCPRDLARVVKVIETDRASCRTQQAASELRQGIHQPVGIVLGLHVHRPEAAREPQQQGAADKRRHLYEPDEQAYHAQRAEHAQGKRDERFESIERAEQSLLHPSAEHADDAQHPKHGHDDRPQTFEQVTCAGARSATRISQTPSEISLRYDWRMFTHRCRHILTELRGLPTDSAQTNKRGVTIAS